MVTGYDHLLFLFGVIFLLYRLKDVGIYVSLFALGHSTTLLLGVFTGVSVNAHLIDAIIGLSVVYKALDNLGAYQSWFGLQPNTKVATVVLDCSMDLVWRRKFWNLTWPQKASGPTLSPSMSELRSGNYWP